MSIVVGRDGGAIWRVCSWLVEHMAGLLCRSAVWTAIKRLPEMWGEPVSAWVSVSFLDQSMKCGAAYLASSSVLLCWPVH